MDCDSLELVHLQAVESTLQYVEKHGERATYEGMIKNISWYWMDHTRPMDHKPKEWVLGWIKSLAGIKNELEN